MRPRVEVVICLERLLMEARQGRITGISYSLQTDHGLEAGWAGQHAGRRLVVVDESRRILAIDDPHAVAAKRFGTER